MAKKKRIITRLISTAGTGYFKMASYKSSEKNKKALELKKFDPKIRKRVLFKEKRK